MSRSFLSKLQHGKPPITLKSRDWRAAILFPVWVLMAFYTAQLIVVAVIAIMQVSGVDFSKIGSQEVFQTVASAVIYVLAFVVTFGVPYALFRRRVTLKTLGLERLMSWTDIGLAPFAYVAYAIVLVGVVSVVANTVPGFQADQVQDVGFSTLSNQLGYILAFTTLVVIAPIAEEVLFRGYLYGKLRGHVSVWAAMLVTSALFGFVHGQWNVAIDTFILSLFLCGLRELTGSIWAGILVHMIKNGVAFYVLFLAQLVTPGLGL